MEVSVAFTAKTDWKAGDTLSADAVNRIESGIAEKAAKGEKGAPGAPGKDLSSELAALTARVDKLEHPAG